MVQFNTFDEVCQKLADLANADDDPTEEEDDIDAAETADHLQSSRLGDARRNDHAITRPECRRGPRCDSRSARCARGQRQRVTYEQHCRRAVGHGARGRPAPFTAGAIPKSATTAWEFSAAE